MAKKPEPLLKSRDERITDGRKTRKGAGYSPSRSKYRKQQAKTISELGQARSIDELLALQTKMAGAQWERTMGYWTELCQTQIAQARDWMSEAAQVATAGSNATMRQVQSGGKQERKAA